MTILGPTILTSRKSTVYAQGTVTEPVLCAATPVPQSPPHTPFVDDLPVPYPAIPQYPESCADPERQHGGRRGRARAASTLGRIQPVDYLPAGGQGRNPSSSTVTTCRPTSGVSMANTRVRRFLTPTACRRSCDSRIACRLLPRALAQTRPRSTCTTGIRRLKATVSRATSSAQDCSKTITTPMPTPALMPLVPRGVKGDPREAMHTFWYHDHLQAETANNNYLGMNGMYLAYDQTDPPGSSTRRDRFGCLPTTA